MADEDLDRSEAATPFKLERARERGVVAKSSDVSAFAILAVATLVFVAWLPFAQKEFGRLMDELLSRVGGELTNGPVLWSLYATWLRGAAQISAPLLIAVVCSAVLANLAQVGIVVSTEPLTPDFARLNPAEGFKRLFALRVLYDAAKSALKLGLLSLVLGFVLLSMVPGVSGLAGVTGHALAATLIAMVTGVGAKLVAAVLIVAAIDWIYVRREHTKKMRMSRREIKDEFKQREGDPRIRQRVRELRMQLLKRVRATRGVAKADVLITNPTHIAIAISYEHGVSPAPKVLAKGGGGLAAKMREVANRHRVPIVESPPLARALFREVDDEGFVPEHWYPQVAKILVWVMAARRKQGQASRGVAA